MTALPQDPRTAFDDLMGLRDQAAAPAMPVQSVTATQTRRTAPMVDRSGVYAKQNAAAQALKDENKAANDSLDAQQLQADADADTMRASGDEYVKRSDEALNPLSAEQEKLQKQYDEITKARTEHNANVQNAINNMDEMSKRIAAEQPHDIWAEAGLGTKIGAIALMGLGAAAQSIYHDKTNAVTDQIDAAITRDLTQQRLRTEKNKSDYANKNLLLNQMREHFDHDETAQQAAYVTAWQGVTGRLAVQKALLSAPEMRANIDKTIAQANIKIADARMKLQTTIGGQEVRMKDAQAVTEAGLAKADAAGGRQQESLALREGTEQRLQNKEGRTQASIKIPGWEGEFGGTPASAEKFRGFEDTARNVFKSMGKLRAELEKAGAGGVKDLTSLEAYREYKQAQARLTEAARGAGFGQTGARLTDTVKKLEEDAFSTGFNGAILPRLDAKGSSVLIKRAQLDLLGRLRDVGHERNLKAKGHDLISDDK